MIILRVYICLLIFLSIAHNATAAEYFTVSHQGKSYRVPTQGWEFQQMTGSGFQPVQDMQVAVKLAQARDAFTQFLNPETIPHRELGNVMGKMMSAARNKHTLNQFDAALTNVAGSFIGGALRTVAGDVSGGASFAASLAHFADLKAPAIDLVTGAVSTTAAASIAMTSSEALGVGLYFGRMAELSAQRAADFQDRNFPGGRQGRIIPLAELEAATVHAHQALRLAYPSAVLMNEVTHRTGWDTTKSFLRNTVYGAIPGGVGDGMSMLDSAVSATKDGIRSVQALRAFDKAINQGRGNPFETDVAVYREALQRYGGLREVSPLEEALSGGSNDRQPIQKTPGPQAQTGELEQIFSGAAAQQIRELLKAAQSDIEARRLTQPPRNNAVEKYRQAHRLGADAQAVISGFDAILVAYTKMLQRAEQDRDLDAFDNYCSAVRDVILERFEAGPPGKQYAWHHHPCLELDLSDDWIELGDLPKAERHLKESIAALFKLAEYDWFVKEADMTRSELKRKLEVFYAQQMRSLNEARRETQKYRSENDSRKAGSRVPSNLEILSYFEQLLVGRGHAVCEHASLDFDSLDIGATANFSQVGCGMRFGEGEVYEKDNIRIAGRFSLSDSDLFVVNASIHYYRSMLSTTFFLRVGSDGQKNIVGSNDNYLSVENGLLTSFKSVYHERDPVCCASYEATEKYKIRDNGITLISRDKIVTEFGKENLRLYH